MNLFFHEILELKSLQKQKSNVFNLKSNIRTTYIWANKQKGAIVCLQLIVSKFSTQNILKGSFHQFSKMRKNFEFNGGLPQIE